MVSRLSLGYRNLIGAFLNSTNIRASWAGLERTTFNTILDVGAADGRSVKKFLKLWPQATIHAFEPQTKQFTDLAVYASEHENVIAHYYALSSKEFIDSNEDLRFHSTPDYPRAGGLLKSLDYCTEPTVVQIITLDDWYLKNKKLMAERAPLKSPTLLKIDAQGHDLHVLEGGIKFLTQVHSIVVEIVLDEMFTGQSSFYDYIKFLNALGFKYAGNIHQHSNKEGHIRFIDALFIRT